MRGAAWRLSSEERGIFSDILQHEIQNIRSRGGLRTTDHGKPDAFWSCPDGRAMPWSQCGSGDGRPQATYVDPATRKIRRSLLA